MDRKHKKDLILFDGEAVARRRLALNMTRDELVDASGCSARTVWSAHNAVPVSLRKARDIARALRMSLRSLCAPQRVKKQGGEAIGQDAGHEPATAGAA